MMSTNPAGIIELDDDTLQDTRGGQGTPYASLIQPDGVSVSTGTSKVTVDCCTGQACIPCGTPIG